MKSIVETVGSTQLLDAADQLIPYNRPAVVRETYLIQTRIANGTVRVLAAELPDEANDEDFLAFWREAPDIAVEAYVSTFADEEKPSEPKRSRSSSKRS